MSASLSNRWAAESDAILRSLWAEELPTAEIAIRLGCSRSAVIARASRLALPARRAVNQTTRSLPPDATDPQRPRAPIVIAKPRREEVLLNEALPVAPIPSATRWADMAVGQCRNIIGEEEDVFDRLVCGNPAESGSSYCSMCRLRMWCSPEQVMKLLKRKPASKRPGSAA